MVFISHNIKKFIDYNEINSKTSQNEKDNNSGQINTNLNKKDTIEISYKGNIPIVPIENYNDIIKLMPKSCFTDLWKEVDSNLLEHFSNPTRDIGDLKEYYKEILEAQGVYNLQDSYDLLLNKTVGNAFGANLKQAREIAKEYNHTGDSDFVYYDADYHYALEEAKDVLKEVVSEMAKEHKVTKINLEGTEKRRNLMVGSNYSFNETWAMNSSQIINRSTLIDTDIEPPKGFTMFYKEGKYTERQKKGMDFLELQKGVLRVSMGEWSKEIDIPFNNSLILGKTYEVFNGGDLILATESNISDSDKFNNFIRNFNLYTRSYDFLHIKTKSH